MRRGSRIATSVAAAGVLITGAGAALAAIPTSGHAHSSASGETARSGPDGSAVVVDRLKAQATADQKQADALSRAIGRTRARVAAEQRAFAAEQAARAAQVKAAEVAAAQRAAVPATQPNWPTAALPAAATQQPRPDPAPSSTAAAPPPVATTTGASGAGGAGSGDDGGSGSDD
jgi:hypothetical protein